MESPELGVGLVYVPGLEPLLEPGSTCVDVVEIEIETLWRFKEGSPNPYVLPTDTLAQLEAFPQPKVIHSVGLAVGGTQRPSAAFARALADTIRALKAPWASGHLSFTQFGLGEEAAHTGFMLPALQTVEGALTAAHNISSFADQLPVPLAVETTVNYLKTRDDELTDGAFVALAVETADCGILLDLHNIWTNERNGRQPVAEFLADIPLERVWEIHLGGGFEFDGYWLDAHSGAVPAPVLDWAEQLIPVLPNLKAVTYEIYPSFVPLFGLDRIRQQLAEIDSIWSRRHDRSPAPPLRRDTGSSAFVVSGSNHAETTPEAWEKTLGDLIVRGEGNGQLAQDLAQDKGTDLVRKLVWKFRASAIVKTLSMLTQLIQLASGEEYLEQLLDNYFDETAPQAFSSKEATCFLAYLRQQDLDIPFLDDLMLYEEHVMRALLDGEAQYLHFKYDPRVLLDSLADGKIPENLEAGSYELEVTP